MTRLNEHHQTSLAMTPSPNLIAAILAATTQNPAIALCGNSLALYNPPNRVAEEIAMLDCISGGRIIAGIVFGTPMDTGSCTLGTRTRRSRPRTTTCSHQGRPQAAGRLGQPGR